MSAAAKILGVYLPPHLRRAHGVDAAADERSQTTDMAQDNNQRLMWEALRKSITGAVNKATSSNVQLIAVECLRENLVRGRGIFCKAVMRAQAASPESTCVFACLASIINSKIPAVGDLLVRRLIFQFRRLFNRGEVMALIHVCQFLSHLVMQYVQADLLILKMLSCLLVSKSDVPSSKHIEVAAALFRECFRFLEENNPEAFTMVLEPIRELVRTRKVDFKSECVLDGLLRSVRDWQTAKERESILRPELEIVLPEDQHTHQIDLEDEIDIEQKADNYVFDPDWQEHEDQYDALKQQMLGEDDGAVIDQRIVEQMEKDAQRAEEDEVEQRLERIGGKELVTNDATEVPQKTSGAQEALSEEQVVAVRKHIFLQIRSSMRAEEIAHKLLKHVPEEHSNIAASMVLETAHHEKSFDKCYPMVGEILCRSRLQYQVHFQELFVTYYARKLEELTAKEITIVGRFFAFLFRKNSVHWSLLANIVLTEETTTVSTRRFIKDFFQELGETMGKKALLERMSDPELQPHLSGLFPRDSMEHARFAVNFFQVISEGAVDLGELADNLRKWFKAQERSLHNQLGTEGVGQKRSRDT